MPVEIRELVMKATILEEHEKAPCKTPMDDMEKEDIVAQCVDQVMKIMKEKYER